MTDYPHLKRAPIVEALIDIRASLPGNVDVGHLAGFTEQVKIDYPDIHERCRGFAEIAFDESGPAKITVPPQKVDGFLLRSTDERQVVQGRLDGFTFSRLTPYQTGEKLFDEAQNFGRYIVKPFNLSQ